MVRSSSVSRHQLWQQRLARFQTSHQTVVEFCRQEGVSPPSFYLWRKRLLPSVDRQPSKPPAGFRAVHLLPSANVSVQLPGGTQLVVPMADHESLRAVIEAVARVDAARLEGDRPC